MTHSTTPYSLPRRTPVTRPDSYEDLCAIDRRIVRLARSEGALRLGIGEGLDMLARHGGPIVLGFPTLASYTTQRLERTGRFAAESRSLARRLA